MVGNDQELGFGPWAFFLLAMLVVAAFAFVVASQTDGTTGAVGISGLIFLAAAMVGALLGFIFAVPRVISRGEGEGEAVALGVGAKVLSTNTNLERISDWLTTMLVGVGLSQLTNVGDSFLRFQTFLAENAKVFVVNGQPSAGMLPAVGPFILMLGAASGFLFMYLMTRLVLVAFFKKSEDMLSPLASAAVRVAAAGPSADLGGAPPSGGPLAPGGPVSSGAPTPEPGDGVLGRAAVSPTLLRASHATALSAEDALGVMYELLYRPDGYRSVIQMSGELSQNPIAKRAQYWFLLSAAFGQQMHHLPTDSDEYRSAATKAIEAAARAIQIDASYRARLWDISTPGAYDNDLELLRDEPNFRKLVGR